MTFGVKKYGMSLSVGAEGKRRNNALVIC